MIIPAQPADLPPCSTSSLRRCPRRESTHLSAASMPPARAAGSKRRRVNELLIALTAIATPAAAFQTAGLPLRVRRPSISARGTPVAQAHLWQPPTGRRRPATLASAEQSRLPRPRAWARWVPRVLAVIAVTPSALWAAGLPVRAVLPPNTWTIPLVAGVLNMVTNKLAVKMMFYPLRFVTAAPSNLGPSDSGAAALEAVVPLRYADARCPAAHSAALAAWAGTASCRPRRCPWLTTSSITSCYASSTLARSSARLPAVALLAVATRAVPRAPLTIALYLAGLHAPPARGARSLSRQHRAQGRAGDRDRDRHRPQGQGQGLGTADRRGGAGRAL